MATIGAFTGQPGRQSHDLGDGPGAGSARLVAVEVAQQQDLGPVVDRLTVDVQHQLGIRVLAEGPFSRPDRPGQASRSSPSTPLIQAPYTASSTSSASAAVAGHAMDE